MKVLELKGYKSLRAFNAFHTLLLGVKMLPAYQTMNYEQFFDKVEAMPPADQVKILREAAFFVVLDRDEIEALMSFCVDKNGVPYSAENLKNLGPAELVEIVISVCAEIAKIKVDLISPDEKKN